MDDSDEQEFEIDIVENKPFISEIGDCFHVEVANIKKEEGEEVEEDFMRHKHNISESESSDGEEAPWKTQPSTSGREPPTLPGYDDWLTNSYAVVEFADGMQLVPSKWVTGKTNKMCFLPSFANSKKYDKAVENLEEANESWHQYQIKRIINCADSFQKGKRKLKEAEFCSYINFDVDMEEKKKKRRYRAKRIVSESSESDGINSESPSSSSFHGFPQTPQFPSTLSSPLRITVPPQSSPNTTAAVSPSLNNLTPFTPSSNVNLITPFSSMTRHLDSSCTVNAVQGLSECDPFVKKTLIDLELKMNTIMKNQEIIMNEILSLKDPQRPKPLEKCNINLNDYLPLNNTDSVEMFERKLKDNDFRKCVVQELKKGGGSDLRNVVFNLLQKLVTNSVAQAYSWIGGKGKKIFSSLELCKVVLDVVRLHHPEATDVNISLPIKNWLRHAKERKQRLITKAQNITRTEDAIP